MPIISPYFALLGRPVNEKLNFDHQEEFSINYACSGKKKKKGQVQVFFLRRFIDCLITS